MKLISVDKLEKALDEYKEQQSEEVKWFINNAIPWIVLALPNEIGNPIEACEDSYRRGYMKGYEKGKNEVK